MDLDLNEMRAWGEALVVSCDANLKRRGRDLLTLVEIAETGRALANSIRWKHSVMSAPRSSLSVDWYALDHWTDALRQAGVAKCELETEDTVATRPDLCPKCGGEMQGPLYEEAFKLYLYNDHDERLRYTCQRCGYRRYEPCLDAKGAE